MELDGKVALVTGASSGIGRAVSSALAAEGAHVLACARSREPLETLATDSPGCSPFLGDATDPAFAESALSHCLAHFGRCDIVVNNAGTMVAGSVDDIDLEKVSQMVRVNVEGAFRMAYVAVRHFKKQGAGHLVNTSSILGTKIRPTAGAYAGTKFAIEALSEDLRIQLAGSGVKVTCIQPGLVMTGLHRDFPVHPKESMNIQNPLMPKDIADCVVWVLKQPHHVLIPRLMVMPAESAL